MEEPEITDSENARLAASGDVSAFRILVESYQVKAVSIAFSISGDFHASEDIAQEAFVKAHQYLARFNSEKASFSTWFFSIVKNTALNHRRKIAPILTDESDSSASPANSPSVETSRREQWRLLDHTLDQLEEPFRSAFILAELEDLPLADIARIEQAPVGTIKSRINRARKKLREALTNSNAPLS